VSFLAGGLFWQTGLRSPKSPEAGLKNDYYELIRNEIDKKDMKLVANSEVNVMYPYTVQVGSYKQRDSAIEVVNSLKKLGFDAYSSMVMLDNIGECYRVEIGAFKNMEETKNFIIKLRSSIRFSGAWAKKTPYAIEIDNFDSEKYLKVKESELIAIGYSPYTTLDISGKAQSTSRLLIGAFTSKEQALYTSEQLKKDGIEHKISER
ncbi:MAG: SPOR domain-containing protein, partial [Thermodesulfobacteriota bacterium]|nr:SPOR domain-containing protein [Thermodesulfobacteriota bacterium]